MRWVCWAPKCGGTVHVVSPEGERAACVVCKRFYDVREWKAGGHVARLLPKPKEAKPKLKKPRADGWREVGAGEVSVVRRMLAKGGGVMSALDDAKHGGVFKAAGVVQIGSELQKARLYMRDAQCYAEGLERVRARYARELADEERSVRECASRSVVCAVEAFVRWGLS